MSASPGERLILREPCFLILHTVRKAILSQDTAKVVSGYFSVKRFEVKVGWNVPMQEQSEGPNFDLRYRISMFRDREMEKSS